MTRSIFDPTGDDVIQEGDRFTTPTAGNRSHMPPSAIDGEFKEDQETQVPLVSGEAPEPLDTSETDALAQAAEEARRNDFQNPDQRNAGTPLSNPGDQADRIEEGSEWTDRP
jgi:hypothetical protein